MRAERYVKAFLALTVALNAFISCCSGFAADLSKFSITSGGQPVAEIVVEAGQPEGLARLAAGRERYGESFYKQVQEVPSLAIRPREHGVEAGSGDAGFVA